MSSNTSRCDLSVVILCYRSEEAAIPFVEMVIAELKQECITDFELVLVANYHKDVADTTPEVVRNLAQSNSKIVPVIHEKKGMMGWDVIQGLNAAKGDAIALIDGDGQMPPNDIVRLYKVLSSGEFDFVKTYRTKRYDGIQRLVISHTYNAIFRFLFPGFPYRDINSKPKLWNRTSLLQLDLQCTGWFSDGEMMLEARRLGFSFAEIPTVFQENEWRGSFVNIKTILEIFFSMIRYRLIYWFKR